MAISDFVPALGVGDPWECRGYVAIPPCFGPQRRHVLGGQFLILSPRLALGTPRMKGLRSKSALFWGPEKAHVRWPLLILSPGLA